MAKPKARDAQLDARRARRAAAQQVFDNLAAEYLQHANVSQGPMFGSEGLLHNGKFFAFVGRAGALVLKLPEAHAAQLVAAGEAEAVRAGRNATREWVSVADTELWPRLLRDAYQHAASQR